MMVEPNTAVLGQVLSHAIVQASGSQQASLPEMQYRAQVTIQNGNVGNTPIFCVPGAGCSVTSFFDLADAVGEAWPIHGMQPRGLDGVLNPHSTIEDAAIAYVQEIEAMYPDGPVHLLGHSFGAWVVLEMAYLLREMNRTVASLTIIDKDAPDSNRASCREYTTIEVLANLIEILEQSAETSLGIDPAVLELLDETQQLELLHQGMVRVGLMGERTRAEALRGVLRTFGAALRTGYRPQERYSGPLHLVLVFDELLDEQANRRHHDDVLEGWRQLAPKVTAWHGPGNHMTVLKQPAVHALASWWLTGDSEKNNA